jgi:outer membrane receptor protein involved in Fe transport
MMKATHGWASARQGLLLAATAMATGLASPLAAQSTDAEAPAQAPQRSDTAQDDSGADGEIIVTGSRAAMTGFAAPSVVSMISNDTIQQQARTTVADVLLQEPAFRGTRSPGGNANNFANPGQSAADLRGLGGQRTLVLIDSARIVPAASAVTTGAPVTTDLNVIPTSMVDRVEVVTGGASAQYGSDAVAGVVNIILKKKFTGLQFTAQAGVTQYGDNFRHKLGGVAGEETTDGRGNLVVSIEATESEGVRDLYERDWGAEEWMIVSNANFATNGLPANIQGPNVKNSNSQGGRITSPGFSLSNYTFNDDGTVRPYIQGTIDNGTYQLGGEGLSRNTGSSLVPAVKRFVAYARGSYEVSSALTVILEGGYSRSMSMFEGGFPNTNGPGFFIQRNNAFLPQVVRDAMIAENRPTISVARGFYDIGNIHFRVKNDTPHGTIGVEGDLGGAWSYDAHYSYGVNKFRSDFTNNFTNLGATGLYQYAVDAVYADPATNQIHNFIGGAPPPANYSLTCRALVPGSSTYNPAAAAGCVPLNIFGPTSADRSPPGAIEYVNRSDFNAVTYKQHSAAVNLRGEPFSTWAGPVSVALGGEYRKESQVLTAGPMATSGRFALGNATPFSGEFDVKEGYFEAIVPLARDVAFARSLDINGAIRYADYQSAGGQTTWKVGGVWEPLDGLRFRVSRSRDIRAPAIYELFSPGSSFVTLITVNGISANIPQNRTVGNPDLRPEVANTWTVGAVVQPRGFPGLNASIDYYKIDIRDGIDSLLGNTIGNLCTQGVQTYCDFITFNGAGVPVALRSGYQNIGAFVTSGLDLALSYRLSLGGTSSLMTRFVGTYALHSYITTSGVTVDHAGENGQGILGQTPRFRGNLSSTYDNGRFSLTGQLLYISKGTNDNAFNTAPALTINDNQIEATAYVNLYSSYKLTDNIEVTATIDNLLNRDPPVAGYAVQGQAVNGQLYDKLGRSFMVGVNFDF